MSTIYKDDFKIIEHFAPQRRTVNIDGRYYFLSFPHIYLNIAYLSQPSPFDLDADDYSEKEYYLYSEKEYYLERVVVEFLSNELKSEEINFNGEQGMVGSRRDALILPLPNINYFSVICLGPQVKKVYKSIEELIENVVNSFWQACL